jgi:hypothetical protein
MEFVSNSDFRASSFLASDSFASVARDQSRTKIEKEFDVISPSRNLKGQTLSQPVSIERALLSGSG